MLTLKFILFVILFDVLIVFLIKCEKQPLLLNRHYRHSSINFHIANLNQHETSTAIRYN